MKVTIAKSAGFCFGVKRAIEVAFQSVTHGKRVEMLGDIVHNNDVVSKINNAGIKTVSKLRNGKNKILLIRAHGAALKTFEKAKKLGYEVIDATCPMVKEIHHIVSKKEKDGYAIIIIGDKKHDEVQGIVGQLKSRAVVVDSRHPLPVSRLKKMKKAAVVVQSTQNIDRVLPLVEELKKYIHDLEFCNTICQPTRVKQKEIRSMPIENDLILVIGSKHSANTKRLYEISSSLNKNTHWIESLHELNSKWFKGIHSVGITAGASTPQEVTMLIAEKVKKIFK